MRVITLALKDIRQVLRDINSAIFLVLMPIVFTVFMGLIMAPGERDNRVPIGWINQDGEGVLGSMLFALLDGSESVRLVPLQGDEVTAADADVGKGELAAAIIVPAGSGERVLGGEQPRVEVIIDRSTPAGQAAWTAIHTAMARILGTLEAAQLGVAAFEEETGTLDESARRAYMQEAFAAGHSAWQEMPSVVKVEQAGPEKAEAGPASGYAQTSPGMLVQFAVAGLMSSAMVLVLERKSGSLQRLMTTTMTRMQIIGGHTLAMFVVVFVQQVLLVAVGQFALGVDYLSAPGATLCMMIGVALWASSLGLFIGAAAKGQEQVIMWSLIAMFVFAALGGAWFPLEVTGSTFATIGHLLPSAWAMDGFQNIVVRGLGLASIVVPVAVLVGWAALFMGLAVWRLRAE
ncbi:MAG: ABC transporter permease [Anaerolineae bacterium]